MLHQDSLKNSKKRAGKKIPLKDSFTGKLPASTCENAFILTQTATWITGMLAALFCRANR
ncbi:hypothetical protein CZ787_01915 [Halomonas citrativorans]|uniref:Uncharacterized protein n=1 Tax=Halomonas citrativorans TaxID=2742612 RepID=A0A1R4HQ27_9GAMM|nr:hypothetical protein CZ787_01915 [Halomonas citrativorans]